MNFLQDPKTKSEISISYEEILFFLKPDFSEKERDKEDEKIADNPASVMKRVLNEN